MRSQRNMDALNYETAVGRKMVEDIEAAFDGTGFDSHPTVGGRHRRGAAAVQTAAFDGRLRPRTVEVPDSTGAADLTTEHTLVPDPERYELEHDTSGLQPPYFYHAVGRITTGGLRSEVHEDIPINYYPWPHGTEPPVQGGQQIYSPHDAV